MSHQPTRTSDIASEWPEEHKKKSSKITSTSKSTSTLRSVTGTSRTTGSTSQTKYGKTGEREINADIDVDIEVNVEMSDEDDVGEERDEAEEWDGKSCLFCPQEFEDFDECLEHKEEKHGFHIPEKQRLLVDEETLLSYCHVVLHRYLECIKCGTRRQTLKPLQAHMRDKGHCGFGLEEESDFRAFYGFTDEDSEKESEKDEGGEGGEDGEDGIEVSKRDKIAGLEKLEDMGDGQVRLPSGRVVGSKTCRVPRLVKDKNVPEAEMLQDGPSSSSTQATPTSTTAAGAPASSDPSAVLTRSDRRNLTTSTALSQLRHEDRMQLTHLPAAQQRAVLSTQKKQAAKERRAQQWMEGRVKGKGNKFLQARYRADGPGRANG